MLLREGGKGLPGLGLNCQGTECTTTEELAKQALECCLALQVEDVITNMKHGAPYRSSVHGETSQMVAYLEWYWKCALRGWVFR